MKCRQSLTLFNFVNFAGLKISDPLFRGEKHSSMQLKMDTAIRFSTEISIDVKAKAGDGIILHFGQSRDARHQDFFTVLLKNNSFVLTFSLGGPRGGGQANALTLVVCCLEMDKWQRVEAGRHGREGYLRANGEMVTGTAPPGLTTLDVDNVAHLGKNILPHRQIKYPVDFDDELKTRKRQIR